LRNVDYPLFDAVYLPFTFIIQIKIACMTSLFKSSKLITSALVVTMFLSTSFNNSYFRQTPKQQTWADKLNFPKGKKVVMLHADDIGMCEEANEAAIQYLSTDKIQSAAIMMTCEYAADMIEWAKKNPSEDIGLHLTLTSEWKTYRWGPLASPNEVPGLLDPDQKLWRDVRSVVEHASAGEVEKEIRAQIQRSIDMGYRPDHIDTHMGTLYGHPEFIKAFFSVAQEYRIPANVIEVSDPAVLAEFRNQGYPITDEVVKMISDYKLPKLDYFTSAPEGKSYDEKVEKFKALIRSLKPGITEIIFHPSVQTENLKTITNSWQQRAWEAKMFSDPDLENFFKSEGIIFTNWNDLMQRFENGRASKTKKK
jgi:predicted glycoside hydrolase/deacetylase ChbG (UPF0249 family)